MRNILFEKIISKSDLSNFNSNNTNEMAQMQLKSIIEQANEILDSLNQGIDIDADIQSKLAVAEDYLQEIQKQLSFEQNSQEYQDNIVSGEEQWGEDINIDTEVDKDLDIVSYDDNGNTSIAEFPEELTTSDNIEGEESFSLGDDNDEFILPADINGNNDINGEDSLDLGLNIDNDEDDNDFGEENVISKGKSKVFDVEPIYPGDEFEEDDQKDLDGFNNGVKVKNIDILK